MALTAACAAEVDEPIEAVEARNWAPPPPKPKEVCTAACGGAICSAVGPGEDCAATSTEASCFVLKGGYLCNSEYGCWKCEGDKVLSSGGCGTSSGFACD